MRNKKLHLAIISVLTAILITFIMSFTAFAVDEGIVSDPYVVETQYQEEPYVPEETQAPVIDEYDDPDNGYDDGNNDYEEDVDDNSGGYVEQEQDNTPEPTYYQAYSEELPEVESQSIVQPTSVKLPDIEVSDTSLMGGVIAWLCVAVGIAVIAGVLVSQRTRQSTGARRN